MSKKAGSFAKSKSKRRVGKRAVFAVISDRETIFRREPTRREIEVIRLISEGYKNREVAEKMGISTKTVETHRANIMNKLALRNIADLIRYAIQKGIIEI